MAVSLSLFSVLSLSIPKFLPLNHEKCFILIVETRQRLYVRLIVCFPFSVF